MVQFSNVWVLSPDPTNARVSNFTHVRKHRDVSIPYRKQDD